MKKVIYKYKIDSTLTKLELPETAIVRAFMKQQDDYCIWVELDPSDKKVIRTFISIGTGQSFPSDCAAYCGTIQDGNFVWHLYEV